MAGQYGELFEIDLLGYDIEPFFQMKMHLGKFFFYRTKRWLTFIGLGAGLGLIGLTVEAGSNIPNGVKVPIISASVINIIAGLYSLFSPGMNIEIYLVALLNLPQNIYYRC